jgi:hypothetical protein
VLSPGKQRLIDYYNLVNPKKTKKQIKEEYLLCIKRHREEYEKKKEADKAAASNTQASSVDSTETTAGSCIAPVNSSTETMAILKNFQE